MNQTPQDQEVWHRVCRVMSLLFEYVMTPLIKGISNGAGLATGAFIFKFFIYNKYFNKWLKYCAMYVEIPTLFITGVPLAFTASTHAILKLRVELSSSILNANL